MLEFSIMINPRWAHTLILIILITLPFERIPSIDLSVGNYALTLRISQAAGLILIAICASGLWRDRGQLLKPPWVWLTFFIFASFLSALLATNLTKALFVSVFTAFVILLARTVSVALTADKLRDYKKVLLVGAFVSCAFGLYQFFGDLLGLSPAWTGILPHYTKQVFGFPRIQSTALEPLYFANFLILPISLISAFYLIRKWSWLYLWLLLPILVTFWLALSRGAYAAMTLGLLVLLGWALSRKLWVKITGLLTTIAISVGLAVSLIALAAAIDLTPSTDAGQNIQQLSTQTTNVRYGESVEGRTLTRQLAWNAFKEHPLLGLGPGNFGIYASQRDSHFDTSTIVNNEPLELLAETGLLGTVSMTAFALSLLLVALRSFRESKSPEIQAWILGLLAALTAIAVQYQTFSTLYITHIWMAIGLLVGISNLALTSKKKGSAVHRP